ncbi:vomeronasal type-2 receptor 26-like [Pseudophryne corroboree]|uniref:vomeronasal type-2 receptor 26-like n=1 Tax=Pseudophryne corroboree TaxID=495146 RepID=UPI003082053A
MSTKIKARGYDLKLLETQKEQVMGMDHMSLLQSKLSNTTQVIHWSSTYTTGSPVLPRATRALWPLVSSDKMLECFQKKRPMPCYRRGRNLKDLLVRTDITDMTKANFKPVMFLTKQAGPIPLYYKYLLTFIFVIEEINKDQTILPNVTLGYHIYDSCAQTKKAVKSVLQILSGSEKTIPNYSCMGHRTLSGFIGDHSSLTTLPMAQILAVYGYTQISYGATSYLLSDRNLYPTFYRTVQGDRASYSVLSSLIKFFGWTWVGVLASDDDSGNEEIQILTEYLTSKRICVAYVIKIKYCQSDALYEMNKERANIIRKSSAQVIILCGTYSSYLADLLTDLRGVINDKTLVFGPTFARTTFLLEHYTDVFNGSLALQPSYLPMLDMRSFYDSFQTITHPEDKLLEHIRLIWKKCLSRDKKINKVYSEVYGITLHKCTGKERITTFDSFQIRGLTDRVYKAVYSMAHALHNMHMYLGGQTSQKIPPSYGCRHQLHRYLRNQRRVDGDLVFNENGDFVTPYKIANWLAFSNNSLFVKHVDCTRKVDKVQQIYIQPNKIVWKYDNNEIPKSQCSENCKPGTRKVLTSALYSCCYSCIQCSEGQISNVTDSENCLKCADHEWPNEKKTRCVPKELECLSYSNDTIVDVFLFASFLLCFLTSLILRIFILHRDTPLVKANNKNLSFLLLVSIMLSILSVFLFLGRPVDATCMLRQISFGILFSVAISCVLGKTIMVYIVFKTTKPGSSWESWINTKLSNGVVLLCSSIQVIICMSWVTVSPPFQELDTHSYQGKIIVQCNEGSLIGFYSVLGYMGILAAISFITAFLARTLPDSFNEAKYITFSMLVFCSVWITMIPAYLSAKGKYMVAVEIFAILASCAGLLGCIFFPKCYIILWRPELNTRKHLLEKEHDLGYS